MDCPEWKSNGSGHIILAPTNEANNVKQAYKLLQQKRQLPEKRLSFEEAFTSAGGTLSKVLMQYGQYLGNSFQWIALNDPGWCMHMLGTCLTSVAELLLI